MLQYYRTEVLNQTPQYTLCVDSCLYTVDNTEASNRVVLHSCDLNVFYLEEQLQQHTKQLSGYIHHVIEKRFREVIRRLLSIVLTKTRPK